jgi:thiamine biosynthesis lipoprotein ApbE
MKRRSFLKLPVLLPLIGVPSAFDSTAHHFQYERVIGTSLDLIVCSPDDGVAEGACRTVREEIDRLASILDTRDPASEISRLEHSEGDPEMSPELAEVLRAYEYWERRTGGLFSIRPGGAGTPRNVDALGKAYILDHAAAAARNAWPSLEGLMLNIGGDIVMWGPSCEIAIADPDAWYDNARPIATIGLRNAAVATSGTYARGAHLTDPRSGRPPRLAVAATVVASDAVTGNALATTLCLTSASDGLQLVESTPASEALRIESGVRRRTSGFALLERPVATRTAAPPAQWPAGYQLTVTLPLTAGRSSKRPYVAVWVEDASGKLVRGLALWGTKSKYHPDLSALWTLLQGNTKQLKSVTRATRSAGKYDLMWDGLDEARTPVPLGSYRIVVETNQENGTYAKQAGTISLGDSPASITLPATTNFEAVVVQYGPRP